MGKKTVETTTSGLKQAVGRSTLAPLATEEVTELGTYFPKSGGGDSGFEPTEAQLEAMNSGITSEDVAQITTNKNNITTLQETIGTINSVLEEVL